MKHEDIDDIRHNFKMACAASDNASAWEIIRDRESLVERALDELAALRERGRCEWKPTAEYGPPIVLGEEMLGHWQDRGYTGIARVSRTAGGVLGWRGVNMHGSPTHLAPLPEAPR